MTVIDIELHPEDYGQKGSQPTTWRLQKDGFWTPLNGDVSLVALPRPLIVGTVGGRHSNMKADYYLIGGRVEPGQETYDYIYDRMVTLCEEYPGATIHLIYTGLTEITLAAIFGLLATDHPFEILRYDRGIDGYIPIDLSRFRLARAARLAATQP